MIDTEFQVVLDGVLKQVETVLGVKATEYATNDRLHNFKQAANLTRVTPEEALAGMMIKHTVSIYDMIATTETYPLDMWDEKIIDHINYLILLKALVVEKSTTEKD